MPETQPNVRLREWRTNANLSRAEMAKMVNLTRSGIRHGLTCDEERIRRWEAGEVSWPREPYRLALAELTHRDPEDLGFAPVKRSRAQTGVRDSPIRVDTLTITPSVTDLLSQGEDEDDVRRREFVGLTGAALFTAVIGEASHTGTTDDPIENLAAVLVDYSTPVDGPIDLDRLAATIATAKQNYQACRYSQVASALPALLRNVRAACALLDGDARLRAHALSAEAHQVAASILLKQEDKGMAWLAADRSIHAAHASQSPLMIGASSRTITHALMDGGHHRAATDVTRIAAQRMNADLPANPSADELSIYGSLLLRGAVAAAKTGNRHAIAELLDEAADAGRRLGHEGNHMWTRSAPTTCYATAPTSRSNSATPEPRSTTPARWTSTPCQSTNAKPPCS
ncbi:transcriptional regulator with XRE-family HTH domain [Thermocatellispora tengchongensis]|uniref:Transcriptional regulator with XRE-family HTH domain n=1 Tax=Thermocatellispora tengchongensis TaxID=1073253 RepID=A0A840NSN0_9ACTN|nr:helix-turn-helix transcriptional regulator [Thermocatellispora tengchongensis]MBB5130578.1 transcriptional regulator with XRE-family HTH domain [Thermocatellispora tengchongensis]